MNNVRKSVIDINEIREFFCSSRKELLISSSTKEVIVTRELPLVQRGPLVEEKPEILATEVAPETPLVQGPSNNVFIKTGSMLNGFDVTGPTPTVQEDKTLMPSQVEEKSADDLIVETAIDSQVSTPINEPISMPTEMTLETPQTFNDNLNVEIPSSPTVEPTPIKPAVTDSYILANVEIEKIRTEFNNEIEKILTIVNNLKHSTNMNLDNVSRNVEKARQMSQNETIAVRKAVQDGIQSFNQVQYQNEPEAISRGQ